jgi:hypothetical protein
MKRSLLLGLAVLTVSLSANAYDLSFSDINPLFNYSTNTQASNTTSETIANSAMNTISQLNNKIASTDRDTQNSFFSLVSLLSPQKEAQTMQSKLSSIMSNAGTTQSAKSMAVSQLMTAYASNLVSNKASVLSTIAGLSANDKTALVNTITALAQNEYQYLNIAGDYTKAAGNLARTSQNMATLANNLMAAKETANAIRTNAQAIKNVVTQASSLAQASGLKTSL